MEEKTIKLDLACGKDKCDPSYIGVDIVKLDGVDVVHNLDSFLWPWDNDSVDEIFCKNYIEHVGDLIKFMNECGRILKQGGKITLIAPYYSSIRAWQDPTHVRAISEASFLYYNKEWREQNGLDHYPIDCDFNYSFGYAFTPEWAMRSEEARNFAIKHYINVVTDIQVSLTKK